jgi:heterodisulfide reductase subunit B
MKYAFFPGCKVTYFLSGYGASSRLVLERLGVELVDIRFDCCGYPIEPLHFMSFLHSAARNLALAEDRGLSILTPCQCCFGTLKKAEALLKNHPDLFQEVNRLLKPEGLFYQGTIQIQHLLTALYQDIGLTRLKQAVLKPFSNLKIAAHYGCHILRPSKVVSFDHPLKPVKFDQLIELTGAQSIPWSKKMQCCGNPLQGRNDPLSQDLGRKKIEEARKAGADALSVACNCCQIQFETALKGMQETESHGNGFSLMAYPQLLGLSLGL